MANNTTNNIPPNIRQDFFSEALLTPDPNITIADAIQAGDAIWTDPSDHFAKRLSDDTNAAYFRGLSNDQWPMNVYPNEEEATTIKVLGVDVCDMFTTVGETYQPLEKVYMGATPQTITNVAGANPIGTVTDEARNFGLVGAAGVKINVNIRRRLPNDVAIS